MDQAVLLQIVYSGTRESICVRLKHLLDLVAIHSRGRERKRTFPPHDAKIDPDSPKCAPRR